MPKSNGLNPWGPRLLGFGLAAAYLPDTYQGATAGRWGAASIGISLLLWFVPKTRVVWVAAAILALAMLSCLWAPFPVDAVNAIWRLSLAGGAFALGMAGIAVPIFEGAAVGMLISSAVAVGQEFGWELVPQTVGPAGLFGNKDFMAEVALLCLLWAAWSRRWILAAFCLPAFALPLARSAVVALFAALAVGLWSWNRRLAIVTGVMCALALGGTVTMKWNHFSVMDRVSIWEDSVQGLTIFGRGVGQYYGTFPEHATHQDTMRVRADHAHNDWLEVDYELGIPGLVLAVIFAGIALAAPGTWERVVFAGFCVDGLFAFPLHNAAPATLGLLAAGALYRNRDSVWLRHGRLKSRAHPGGPQRPRSNGQDHQDRGVVAVRPGFPALPG